MFGPDFFERLSQRMYYDLDGNPITQDQWSVLRLGAGSDHVARDHIGFYHVSTVWTGIDSTASLDDEGHDRSPLIYETMVFVERLDPDGMLSEDDLLDCTEQHAEIHPTREARSPATTARRRWFASGSRTAARSSDDDGRDDADQHTPL